MTDFEKSIKRVMTREKYLKIRDHIYGDGNNTFSYTYGQVSSWLTWNRDNNDQIKKLAGKLAKGGHFWDGPIGEDDNWDKDKLLPVERQFSSKITTNIVFIGLNMSGDGTPCTPPNWFPFQNARGHRKIVKTFFGTTAEGAYFTDIIKPDKRFLDHVGNPSNAGEVMKIVKTRRDILKEHIHLFEAELDFIGAVKPLLIVFGKDARWIVEHGMSDDFITKRFCAIVYIMHYSSFPKGGDEGYKDDTRSKLKLYITIPYGERFNKNEEA